MVLSAQEFISSLFAANRTSLAIILIFCRHAQWWVVLLSFLPPVAWHPPPRQQRAADHRRQTEKRRPQPISSYPATNRQMVPPILAVRSSNHVVTWIIARG